MLDENAFGLLVSYFWIENDEYALEKDEFLARVQRFQRVVLDSAAQSPIGAEAVGLDLGHAIYFEVADGDQLEDPIAWLVAHRGRLTEAAFASSAVLTFGSRWVSDEDGRVQHDSRHVGLIQMFGIGGPSEPLRRALDADGATRLEDADDDVGWGPGLYAEADAIEALGKRFKNAPTPLRAGCGTFYRIGR